MAAPQLKTYFKTFTTDQLGQVFMTGIVNVKAYQRIDLEIIQWPHAAVSMTVRSISAAMCNPRGRRARTAPA